MLLCLEEEKERDGCCSEIDNIGKIRPKVASRSAKSGEAHPGSDEPLKVTGEGFHGHGGSTMPG